MHLHQNLHQKMRIVTRCDLFAQRGKEWQIIEARRAHRLRNL
jgi:hypothetical protein